MRRWGQAGKEGAGALSWPRTLGNVLGRTSSGMALGDDCLVFEARQSLSCVFLC